MPKPSKGNHPEQWLKAELRKLYKKALKDKVSINNLMRLLDRLAMIDEVYRVELCDPNSGRNTPTPKSMKSAPPTEEVTEAEKELERKARELLGGDNATDVSVCDQK